MAIHCQLCKKNNYTEFTDTIGFYFSLSESRDSNTDPFSSYGLSKFNKITFDVQINCTMIINKWVDISDYLPSIYLIFEADEPDVDYLILETYLLLAKYKTYSIENLLSELHFKSERLNFVNNHTEWAQWLYNISNITDFINETGIAIPNWYCYLYIP